MALNVEQITTRLARMSDQQLQQYAQMQKDRDPYALVLAVGEANRRKQLRQSAQAQQGQAPQPKVVDAAVQSMAQPMPEDMGIARLPAGDMNFAGGGIVAFADGGEVERYQFGGSTAMVDRILQKPPQARTPEENAMLAQAGYDVQTRTLGPDSGVSGINTFLQGIGPRMRNYFTAGASRLSDEELAKQPGIGGAQNERILRAMGMAPSTLPLEPQAAYSNEGRRQPGLFAAPTPTPPATPGADKAAPKADATQRGPGTAGAPGATKAATQDAGLAALDPNKLLEDALRKQRGEERPEKDMLKELNKERTAAAEKELEGERALEKRFADAYKGRRERLAAREGELGKMKDQNLGLALLQAGAAMMSTVGNVGTAVGKGIQAGSQQYVAGLDKLNAAKDKLADARDRLDDLQLNRDEMSARSILKAENKIRDTAIAGQENMIKYIMERDKVDRETAAKIVDNQIQIGLTQAGFVNRENVARISAQPAIERNQLLRLAQSKDDKVRTEYGKLQAKVMDTLSKDDNYKMATPAQQQVMQTNALRQALMSNPFLSAYAANVGFSSTPAGGKVYDLTED